MYSCSLLAEFVTDLHFYGEDGPHAAAWSMASGALALAVLLFTVVVLSGLAEDKLGVKITPGIHLQKEPYAVIAQKNSPLLLNCSVTSEFPISKVTWKKNGDIISRTKSRIQILRNGSLFFREIIHRRRKNERRKRRRRSDEGIYECFVTSKVGTILARRLRLLVAGIVGSFLKQPASETAVVGGVARFQCMIKAVPTPVYVWEKDKFQLPQNVHRYTVLPSGILQITNITKMDEGQYRCRASQGALHSLPDEVDNIHWRLSSQAFLTVLESKGNRPPQLISDAVNVTAAAGDPVVLECLIDGTPRPVVTWRRQGTEKLRRDGVVMLVGGSLKFLNVEAVDSGVYICTGSTPGMKKNATVTTTLNVLVKPQISEAPVSWTYPRAHVANFQCRATGYPVPSIRWIFNGENLRPEGRITATTVMPGFAELVITQSQDDDSGYYQCVSENSVGYSVAVARLDIKISEKSPNSPKNVTVIPLGPHTVEISWFPPVEKPCCKVKFYSVHCYKTGMTGNSGGKEEALLHQNAKHYKIVLTHLEPYTNYTFYVVAYGHAAASKHSEYVTQVTGDAIPITAPTIHLTSKNPNSILVQWDEMPAEKRRGVIGEYQLNYYSERNNMIREKFSRRETKQYLITGLDSNTLYHVRLLAGTRAGFPQLDDSQWPWITIRTQDVKPVFAPSNLQVAVLNSTIVLISWDYSGDASGITGFMLRLQKVEKPGQKLEFKVSNDINSYLVKNLENNTYYEVSINAFNSKDVSADVNTVFRTSRESAVPPPPIHLAAMSFNPNVVKLTWDQPVSVTKPIVSYTVRYSPTSNENVNKFLTVADQEVFVYGLQPYTEYQFSVRSHTEDEEGPFGKHVIVRTREGVPYVPVNVQWLWIGPGKVQINWQPPPQTTGVILSYTILYTKNKNEPDSAWKQVLKNGSVTSAVVEGLHGGMYYMKMRANTNAGGGRSSTVFEIKLKCSPPIDQCHPSVSTAVTSKPNQKPDTDLPDSLRHKQQLGIILGITTGIICIFICIIIVRLRHRCFTNNRPPSPIHQRLNGHILSHGNQNPEASGFCSANLHELESRTPMLVHLAENEKSDSKGGGKLILSSSSMHMNGIVISGSLKNGHVPNGHVTSFISSCALEPKSAGENQGIDQMVPLLMASGIQQQVVSIPERSSLDPSTEQPLGSLEDIDHSVNTDKTSSGNVSEEMAVVTAAAAAISDAAKSPQAAGAGREPCDSSSIQPVTSSLQQGGSPETGVHSSATTIGGAWQDVCVTTSTPGPRGVATAAVGTRSSNNTSPTPQWTNVSSCHQNGEATYTQHSDLESTSLQALDLTSKDGCVV